MATNPAPTNPKKSGPVQLTDDEILRQLILDELTFDPRLSGSEIEVTVRQGVVSLAGVVGNNAIKQAAARAAERINGIRAVANGLIVRPRAETMRKDTHLADAVANALSWSALLGDQHVTARVEHGWVVLEGTVRSSFQRIEAERAVHGLVGVHGITNLVTILEPVEPSEAATRIRAALQRHAITDADDVKVEVRPDGIVLSGIVRTHGERQQIDEAAWNSGVAAVSNQLLVRESAYG